MIQREDVRKGLLVQLLSDYLRVPTGTLRLRQKLSMKSCGNMLLLPYWSESLLFPFPYC